MNLTKNFTLSELTASATAQRLGFKNQCPKRLIPALKRTAEGLETIRSFVNNQPIYILSGYRSKELNKIVGGSATSQHMKAEACDIVCPGWGSIGFLACTILEYKNEIDFDQLILEPTWVHVSFNIHRARGEILTMRNGQYKRGLLIATE